METRKAILVIGDAMLDMRIEGAMTRISPEAPSPVVEYASTTRYLGGAANVAANIRSLGGKVLFLGIAGNDDAGKGLGWELVCCGVDNKLLPLQEHTTVKTRITCGGQQVLRVDTTSPRPAEEQLNPVIVAELLKLQTLDIGLVVVSDYDKGLLTPTVIQMIKDYSICHGVPVFVDARPNKLPLYNGVQMITPNLAEALQAADNAGCIHPGLLADRSNQAAVCATFLRERYQLAAVVITRGADGATYDAGASYDVPTDPQQVYDVTGAGDTFLASLAVSFTEGRSLHDSVVRANVAAGLAVRQHGTVQVKRDAVDLACRAKLGWAGKLMTADEMLPYICTWRRAHEFEKLVFTNGCFDLLHPGHMHLLRAAKAAGGLLVVAYNSDTSVGQLKGDDRPVIPQQDRGELLASLDMTDVVVMFEGNTEELIRRVKPDVLVKGAEYRSGSIPGADYVASYGGQLLLVEMAPDWSTSRILHVPS